MVPADVNPTHRGEQNSDLRNIWSVSGNVHGAKVVSQAGTACSVQCKPWGVAYVRMWCNWRACDISPADYDSILVQHNARILLYDLKQDHICQNLY